LFGVHPLLLSYGTTNFISKGGSKEEQILGERDSYAVGREDLILALASASSCFRKALTPMMRDPLATHPSIARLNTYDLRTGIGQVMTRKQ
jgi:hypothetical protein